VFNNQRYTSCLTLQRRLAHHFPTIEQTDKDGQYKNENVGAIANHPNTWLRFQQDELKAFDSEQPFIE